MPKTSFSCLRLRRSQVLCWHASNPACLQRPWDRKCLVSCWKTHKICETQKQVLAANIKNKKAVCPPSCHGTRQGMPPNLSSASSSANSCFRTSYQALSRKIGHAENRFWPTVLQLKACKHSCLVICSKPKKVKHFNKKFLQIVYMNIVRHCDKWSGCLFSQSLHTSPVARLPSPNSPSLPLSSNLRRSELSMT